MDIFLKLVFFHDSHSSESHQDQLNHFGVDDAVCPCCLCGHRVPGTVAGAENSTCQCDRKFLDHDVPWCLMNFLANRWFCFLFILPWFHYTSYWFRHGGPLQKCGMFCAIRNSLPFGMTNCDYISKKVLIQMPRAQEHAQVSGFHLRTGPSVFSYPYLFRLGGIWSHFVESLSIFIHRSRYTVVIVGPIWIN